MKNRSIWNDTFKAEYTYSEEMGLNAPKTTYAETFEGSLKTLNRKVLKERRHGHASVNFYDSNNVWLKEIMY